MFTKFDKDIVKDKKDILFLKYLILGLALAFIHIILDYHFGNVSGSLIDAVVFFILLAIYVIAYYGKHFLLAKILFVAFVNLALFVIAAIVPRSEGIYLIYFPLVTTLFTIFDVKHVKISYFFGLVSLILVIILEITNYRPFGDVRLYDGAGHSFIVNLTASLIVVFFSVNFLVRINRKAENHLKENESRLKNLTREVQEQNNALAKTNSELDRFVYSTSHDLRAPLMSILGLVNLTEKDSIEHTPAYLQKVKSQVLKLDDFIKDIISYSRNSRVEVKNEEIDIEAIIDDVVNNLRFTGGSEKIEFRKSINSDGTIISDRSRLSVILNNLISNAIKYHDYEKDDLFINIDVHKNGSGLKISIADNGVGIPEQFHKEVFDMFVRASESSQGSGLGLYIVKEMTEKLGGELSLRSKEGEGSTFTIHLPHN